MLGGTSGGRGLTTPLGQGRCKDERSKEAPGDISGDEWGPTIVW